MTIQNGTKVQEDLTVERISDLQTFLSLEAEWEALLKASGQHHVYLSHRWIAGWLRFFGEKVHLWVLVVKSRGRWIAVAPLVQSVQSWHGLSVRILHFPISFASTNLRCDFILLERQEEATLAVVQYLEAMRGEWDRWELSGLPADSPAVLPLRRFLAGSSFYTASWQPQHDYYHLPVFGSFEEYLNKKSRSLKRLKTRENRFNQAGAALTHRTLKSAEEVMKGIDVIFDLEARSTKVNQIGMIRLEGELRSFYRYLVEAFGKSGESQIDLLEIDGIAVASLLSLRMEGSLLLLHSCYDPSAAAVSPGQLLLRKVFEKVWSPALREIDLNGWTPNVQIWTDQSRKFLKGNLYNKAFRSRLVRFWEGIASTSLRRIFKRAPTGAKVLPSTPPFQEKDRPSQNHVLKDLGLKEEIKR